MKKTLMLLVLLVGLLAGLQAQSTVTIGTGTNTTLGLPMKCNWGYSYSQSVYLKTEINQAMTISKIAYKYAGALWTDNPVVIYMGHTAKTTFSSTTDWVPVGELTEVFNGAVSVAPGWVEITLTTPFVYNGTDNLVIGFDENQSGYHLISDVFYGTATTGINRSLRYLNDGTNPNPASPPTASILAGYSNIQLIPQATGPSFGIAPTTENFGQTQIGTVTVVKNFTISNSGIGSLVVSEISLTGTNSDQFLLANTTLPVTLVAGQSVTVGISFKPTIVGSKTAKLSVVADAKVAHEVDLTGEGVNSIISSFPYTQDFAGTTYPPQFWTRLTGTLAAPSTLTSATSGWIQKNFANNVANGKGACVNIYGTTIKHWLITPSIDLGTTKSSLNLKFDVAMTKYNSAGTVTTAPDQNGVDDKFAVVISTDNGATWTSANTLRLYDNAGSPFVYNSLTTTKQTVGISLTSYSGMIKIGFYGESTIGSNADNDLHIDNVTITDAPLSVDNTITPNATTLSQNYPNPFNPTTTISFALNTASEVKLAIYNARGEIVKVLKEGVVNAGNHSVSFDGTTLNSGMYFYTLSTPNKVLTGKMLLLK